MANNTIKNIFKASRSGEYVAFFTVQIPTMEGPGFVFLGCDAYSEFGFHTGVEEDDSPANILKHIHLLTEDEKFVIHRDKGFTLVLDRYEELSERIEGIIKPVNGQLLFNKSFHNQITKPMREGFLKH